MATRRRIGIYAGGGPAPGINSVISAATIEAINSGWEVMGILDGFEWLMAGRTDMVKPLRIADVTRPILRGAVSSAFRAPIPPALSRTSRAQWSLWESSMSAPW